MEKRRKEEEEKDKERKEGKGREFIPVEMALTGDAKLWILEMSILLLLSHVMEVAGVSDLEIRYDI